MTGERPTVARITAFGQPRSVRTLLFLMSLALLVPSLTFSGYLVAQSASQKRAQLEQHLVQVAADLADDLDREFVRLLAMLDALSVSEALAAHDFVRFKSEANAAVRRLGTEVLLLDSASQAHVDTALPLGDPILSDIEPALVHAALASQSPTISGVVLNKRAQKYVFNILTPLSVAGLEERSLVMVINADDIIRSMNGLSLPPDWVMGVTDRDGKIVARSKDQSSFVGKALSAALLEGSRREPGAFAAVDMTGIRTIRAVARAKLSGWLVSANVPAAVLEAEIGRSQRTLILGGLALLSLALSLAALVARLIIDPMRALAMSAASLKSDAIPPSLISPVREANEVASMLRSASIELKARLERLEESERRLNLAQKTARLAYVDFDLHKGAAKVSDTFEHIFGFRPSGDDATKTRDAFLESVHPADRQRVTAAQFKAKTTPGSYKDEFRIVLPNGDIRWIAAHGETLADASGKVTRMIGTNLDITQSKEQEVHIRFLLREVSHRSKNLLAIIQSMATQTGNSSRTYEAFKTRFGQRLQSMSASHDLLVNQDWQGADLSALVQAQLLPFADDQVDRLKVSGPSVFLTPQAAQSLGLALHELATNATKHGALSVPGGSVEIKWRILSDKPEKEFEMTWIESGGPHTSTPERKGFGHTVLERMVVQTLKGKIEFNYPQQGLTWVLKTELCRVSGQNAGDELERT